MSIVVFLIEALAVAVLFSSMVVLSDAIGHFFFKR